MSILHARHAAAPPWILAGLLFALMATLVTCRAQQSFSLPPATIAAPPLTYQLVARFPHDSRAFTEGLVYRDGQFLESTGLYGQSELRRVARTDGGILQSRALPASLFGEGITLWRQWIVQVTYRSGEGLLYDSDSFRPAGTFHIAGEGWGLTEDGHHWILSDGTATLRFLDPDTRRVVRRVQVRDTRGPVRDLNELEYGAGVLWANIWRTDLIVRIDPQGGKVTGVLDLSDLWPLAERPAGTDVLNGIARDPRSGHLFVTGKYWPWVFELSVREVKPRS